jgi:hypothetical protein
MADEHCGHPGYDLWARFGQGGTPRRPFAVRSAVTAAMAPELTRKAIRDAFFGKQTYATSGDRILLDLTINGQAVGSSLTVSENPVLRVVVNGTAPLDRLDIIRGERLVHSEFPNTLDSELEWTDSAPLAAETWYYVRVTQANGEFAWSTPIWVRCEHGNDSDTHLPLWCDVVWPPAPADRGPDRRTDLAEAARAFGEDPARFAALVQIGHFSDTRGDYVLFRGRDGRDGVPIHVHLYDGFAAPRLYISRGWADFGWVRNGLPKDDLPWPEPTGDWA